MSDTTRRYLLSLAFTIATIFIHRAGVGTAHAGDVLRRRRKMVSEHGEHL